MEEEVFDKRIIIFGVILGLLLIVIFIILKPQNLPPSAPDGVLVSQEGDRLNAEVQREITTEEKIELETTLRERFGASEIEIEVARPYTQEGLEFVLPRITPEYIDRELNPGPGESLGNDAGADYDI